jgi:hypothetical protein
MLEQLFVNPLFLVLIGYCVAVATVLVSIVVGAAIKR